MIKPFLQELWSFVCPFVINLVAASPPLVFKLLFVEPTCGKARHCCYNFGKVYVHACVQHASVLVVQAISPTFMHGFQNYLAKLFSLRSSSAI